MIWLVIALLSTGVLVALAQPFFSKKRARPSVDDRDYLVAQVKEIEATQTRHRDAGEAAPEEIEAALLEARRRLLDAGSKAETEAKKTANSFLRHASVILIALTPIAAVGLYMVLGNPGLEPDEKSALASSAPALDMDAMSEEDRAAMIETMVSGLAARLEQSPDDLEGWLMLGRSYGVQGNYAQSANAFGRAAALAPDNLDIRIAHLEAQLSTVNPQALVIDEPVMAALKEVERLDAGNPLALYFLGQAAQQNGDIDTARAYWERLETKMPPGSEAALSLRKMIDAL